MTLITYPTRVHFADDVLEEALQAELERDGLSAPLLLGSAPFKGSEFFERIRAGLPRGNRSLVYEIDPAKPLRLAVEEIGQLTTTRRVDMVLSFGTARAIELGRKCRRMISEAVGTRLPFYAVPGIDGMPNPCRRNVESWRTSLPSVLICDPTLTLGADAAQSVRATVLSLVRSIEAYLASAYNPPADGMAIDAFNRCITNMPRIGADDGISLQRELMAACLNATLSQEKGIGPTQMLTAALMDQRDDLDEAALVRLILPGASESLGQDRSKTDVLAKLMGAKRGLDAGTLRSFLADIPFANRLADLGLTEHHLDAAVLATTQRYNLPRDAARQVLDAIF
jgi:4-hydroxybutyrate dehydrogenase